MPSDERPSPTGDTSSNIFGNSSGDAGRSWPLPDSAVGIESGSAETSESGATGAMGEAAPDAPSSTFLQWSASANHAPVDPDAETVADESPPLAFPTVAPLRNSSPTKPAVAARRQSLLTIGLLSYASAATLALLYVLFLLSRPREHALESLPDVPPLDVEHGEVMKLVPADADLPPGHQLVLGESRRFGNLIVEPLRVVAEPVEFEHFSGRAAAAKTPTPPVLKLWVRFTNISQDQAIAPLDAELLFRRAMLDDGVARANQFVGPASGRSTPGDVVLMYDHPATSEWDLSDQNLGVSLAPGESLETYLPSSVEGAALGGSLVWRVHFRKGYSPRGYGVTTLVDVVFESSEIVDAESPAAG